MAQGFKAQMFKISWYRTFYCVKIDDIWNSLFNSSINQPNVISTFSQMIPPPDTSSSTTSIFTSAVRYFFWYVLLTFVKDSRESLRSLKLRSSLSSKSNILLYNWSATTALSFAKTQHSFLNFSCSCSSSFPAVTVHLGDKQLDPFSEFSRCVSTGCVHPSIHPTPSQKIRIASILDGARRNNLARGIARGTASWVRRKNKTSTSMTVFFSYIMRKWSYCSVVHDFIFSIPFWKKKDLSKLGTFFLTIPGCLNFSSHPTSCARWIMLDCCVVLDLSRCIQ